MARRSLSWEALFLFTLQIVAIAIVSFMANEKVDTLRKGYDIELQRMQQDYERDREWMRREVGRANRELKRLNHLAASLTGGPR